MTTAGPAAPLAAKEPDPQPSGSTRRVLIAVLLPVAGFAAVAWLPAFTVLVLVLASCCVYEFAGLSARKGPSIELPVAMAAVWAYIILTHFGLIHRYEGILL